MKNVKGAVVVLLLLLFSVTLLPGVYGQEITKPLEASDNLERMSLEVENFLKENGIEPCQLGDPVARFFGNLFVNVMTLCYLLIGHNDVSEGTMFMICSLVYFICFLPISLPVGIGCCIVTFAQLFNATTFNMVNLIENFGLVFGIPIALGALLLIIPLFLVYTLVLCVPMGAWVMNTNFEDAWHWAWRYVTEGSNGVGVPEYEK